MFMPSQYVLIGKEFCSFTTLKKSVPFYRGEIISRRANQLLRGLVPPNCHYATAKIFKKEPKGKKGFKPKVTLTDEEMQQVVNIEAFTEQLSKIVEKLKADYIKHLNIRTSSGSLDSLPVKFEDKVYPLNELAHITRKNPRLIVINLSALPQATQDVKLAILESGMNLNPQQEGSTIYVPVPKVTKEHREILAKNAKALFMKAKDRIREVQNGFVKQAKEQKGSLSEDLVYNTQQQIIAMGDQQIAEAEKIMIAKQNELLGTN